jgi:hypothetical protein
MSENTERRDETAGTPDDTTGHLIYQDEQPAFRDGDPTAPKTHHDEDDTTGHLIYQDEQPGFSGAINIDPDLPS